MFRPEHRHQVHLKGSPEPECAACKIETRDIRQESARALLEAAYDSQNLLSPIARLMSDGKREEADRRIADALRRLGLATDRVERDVV